MAQGNMIRRGGGGVSLPESIAPGETVLYANTQPCGIGFNGGVEYYLPVGYGISCVKTGTYRIKYYLRNASSGHVRLMKNGIEVSGSYFAPSTDGQVYEKILDVPLVAGDQLKLHGIGYGGSPPYTQVILTSFAVTIVAEDIQNELNGAIIAI